MRESPVSTAHKEYLAAKQAYDNRVSRYIDQSRRLGRPITPEEAGGTQDIKRVSR